jgi:hypothetical protein
MAYEWLYGGTAGRQAEDEAHKRVSAELAAMFPAYVNGLGLKKADGMMLTSDNYLDFIKSELIRSAQIAKNAGADIPDSIGFKFSAQASFGAPPINGGKTAETNGMPLVRQGGMRKMAGEYITDLDMPTYLDYVSTKTRLKTAQPLIQKGSQAMELLAKMTNSGMTADRQ